MGQIFPRPSAKSSILPSPFFESPPTPFFKALGIKPTYVELISTWSDIGPQITWLFRHASLVLYPAMEHIVSGGQSLEFSYHERDRGYV